MAIEEDTGFKKQKDSIVSPASGNKNDVFENELRPKNFDSYVGQTDIKRNLKVFCEAAKKRGEPLDHTLFYGPPGLGKTTLSLILATEMGASLRITSGPALDKAGDLAAILTNLKEGDFLFIDEIHRLKTQVEEILYSAMEDFAIDIIVGKGPSARTMRLSVPPFTLVGATTKASLLAGPLRDRFGNVERLRFYEPKEIQQILERSANILKINIHPKASEMLSHSARKTPRIANRLLRRMRDFAEILHSGEINEEVISTSLKSLSIDEKGFDHVDQLYLRTLCESFNGGPAGLSTLASAIGEDENTIEDMIEPYLIKEGMIQKTPRGRIATAKTFQHLKIPRIL